MLVNYSTRRETKAAIDEIWLAPGARVEAFVLSDDALEHQ